MQFVTLSTHFVNRLRRVGSSITSIDFRKFHVRWPGSANGTMQRTSNGRRIHLSTYSSARYDTVTTSAVRLRTAETPRIDRKEEINDSIPNHFHINRITQSKDIGHLSGKLFKINSQPIHYLPLQQNISVFVFAVKF